MNIYNIQLKRIFAGLIFLLVIQSCKKDDDGVNNDDSIVLNNEINDFVWLGLNEIYLWKDDVNNLADDKNSNQDSYYSFLNSYDTPEDLFDDMLYQKDVVDIFSFLVDDYIALENSFNGTSLSNGLDFQLIRLSSDSEDIMAYVKYVANNSDASTKDISRGDFFLTVDGQQLTSSNFSELLFGSNNNYVLGMADITDSGISLNGKTVELTKTEFTENPILISKVIETQGVKVGYIMYNQFILNFDDQLNDAIADLKSQNITELVLDLRYNLGGAVISAVNLSSMITGQFTDELFNKQQWNNRYQSFFEANDPESIIDRFTDTLFDDSTPITHLNLNKVYILATDDSASASELVINGLAPYIDVVHIGTKTFGKYTASFTMYDADNFDRENANPNHTYAMQPIVYKSENADGVSDYADGLTPDYLITYQTASGNTIEGENITNLGILGDENEPFLAKALELITGSTTKISNTKSGTGVYYEKVAGSKDFSLLGKNMYIDFPTIK